MIELQVLVIMGKMFSEPSMHIFYTFWTKSQNPISTMQIVKNVIANLKKFGCTGLLWKYFAIRRKGQIDGCPN